LPQNNHLQAPLKFTLQQQTLWLSPERCIYWEEKQLLLLADLHLGKSGHFRKAGIGVPQDMFKEDMQRLTALVQFFKPAGLVVVGDFFHSHDNLEHAFFEKWRKDFTSLHIQLVKGNHDILHSQFYAGAGITVHEPSLHLAPFLFTHDMADMATAPPSPNMYTFSGHIHPGVMLHGGGKQSLRLPCFYFGQQYAVLPAFGKFTGTYVITPQKGDKVFAIAGKGLVEVA
jgi:uncharacterized protein